MPSRERRSTLQGRATRPMRQSVSAGFEPQRILISFPNEGSVTDAMGLESVIARLTGQRDLRSE